MVEGGICGRERAQLVIANGNVTAQSYIDDIERPIVRLSDRLSNSSRVMSYSQKNTKLP